MLKIIFTAEDLARTRIATGPDPMWEVLLSLYRLRSRDAQVIYSSWRHQVIPSMPSSLRLVTALAPPRGYSADFLTPSSAGPSLPGQLEALRRTPQSRIRSDLERLARLHPGRRTPSWFGDLARGRVETLEAIAQAASDYFDTCIGTYWPQIRAQVDHDRMKRACLLADNGWDAVFATLHPSARWHYPVLEMDYPAEHTLELGGAGLLLQPSFFCRGAPTALAAPELPAVLSYPIEHTFDWALPAHQPLGGDTRLSAILGSTRARILHTVAEAPGTTTDIARRLGIPPSTASRQLTALREAGLIDSHRYGNRVPHSVTALGEALLNGRHPDSPPLPEPVAAPGLR
ncbi:winged helix-turn-helix domain-containing protein [Streptomyces asiaticus]